MGHHKKPTSYHTKQNVARKQRREDLRKSGGFGLEKVEPKRKEYTGYQSPDIIKKMKHHKTKVHKRNLNRSK